MYLAELKLWNFRKYGKDDPIDASEPHLVVPFKRGLNVLVGENDSGKTAILDAIKIVLKTHASEWIRLEERDFHSGSDELRIEVLFKDFTDVEAGRFTEWLGWEDQNTPYLRVIYKAQKIEGRIVPSDITAGVTPDGKQINSIAREYLKCTYLRPLRDVDNELTAHRNSRISQILQGHELFREAPGEHDFEQIMAKANGEIDKWFKNDTLKRDEFGDEIPCSSNKELLKDKIDAFLTEFIAKGIESKLSVGVEPTIKNILDTISVVVKDQFNLGLGTMNRLYMATELLHLDSGNDGLHLCLIEELEAHLHPQAQMKVIMSLQQRDVQFILSTHSPNLTSKIKLQDEDKTNFVICHDDNVYPINSECTELDKKDFKFLDHFLDVTKSNLFFAKGVILVEGWAEEILLPVLANNLGYDLTAKEVSIVNVGSTAYLHYAEIFIRKDNKLLDVPVSIITDLDVSPEKIKGKEDNDDAEDIDYTEIDAQKEQEKEQSIKSAINLPDEQYVRLFIAPHWTLEWCLFTSSALRKYFMEAVSSVHCRTEAYKKVAGDKWNEDAFKNRLIKALKEKKLDKVAVAHKLSEILSRKARLIIEGNDPINYLVDAIKHACHETD